MEKYNATIQDKVFKENHNHSIRGCFKVIITSLEALIVSRVPSEAMYCLVSVTVKLILQPDGSSGGNILFKEK